MKTLALKWTKRGRDAQREFLDFIVSGRSLYAELSRRGFDKVSALGWLADPHDDDMRARLLLEQGGNTFSGRVALYICPLCGDLGCGVVSVKIERQGSNIVWHEFAVENDQEDDFERLEKIGPFRFHEASYREAVLTIPRG